MSRYWREKLRGIEGQVPWLACMEAPPASERAARAREAAERLVLETVRFARPADIAAFVRPFSPLPFELRADVIVFRVEPAALPELPSGYGWKGGAARLLLRRTLDDLPPAVPRDLDVVRLGSGPDERDVGIGASIMARDYARGHGVELIESPERYLEQRDITINELLWCGGELIASPLCVLDTAGQVLRPSRYRRAGVRREPELAPRVLLKMLRLAAEGACRGESWQVQGVAAVPAIGDFELAVELNKALEAGEHAAARLLAMLEQPAQPAIADTLAAALAELAPSLYGGLDFFDNASTQLRKRAAAAIARGAASG